MIDVAALRRDTPGCADLVHLNNAGAALPTRAVLDAVTGHLELESRVGGYEAADAAARSVAAVYLSIAALVGASADDIALMGSATHAWQAAAYAVPLAAGDRVLVDHASYASTAIALLQLSRRSGCVVEVIPDDSFGQVDVTALGSMLDDRVRLVSVTHVPSQSGLVNPVAEVGALLRGSSAWYLVDGCQSAGQVEVDVRAIGCDIFAAAGRKYLRGPRGTGFLYASPRARVELEPNVLDLHAAEWTSPSDYTVREDARRFEGWERSIALVLGLGVAVDQLLALGVEPVTSRIAEVAATLRARLAEVPGVVVRDRGARLGGIVTFTVEGSDAFEVRDRLRAQRINVSASARSVAQLDLGARDLDAVVRASVHAYNTDDELAALVDAVVALRPSR